MKCKPIEQDKREHVRAEDYVCIRAGKISMPVPSREIKEALDSDVFPGTILKADISEDGLGFISDNKYAVGDYIEIIIQFHGRPTGYATAICGEVRWIKDVTKGLYETGVKFIMVDENVRRELAKIIAKI